MSITLNGVELPVGEKQYIGATEVKDIVINGVNVWHYDSVPPTITVTSKGGYVTVTGVFRRYTLSGVVTDSDSGIASLTVDGDSVTVNNDGTFSYGYIPSGEHTFTITATDNAGNSNTVTHYINYDNSAHEATLNSSLITTLGYSSTSSATYSHNGWNSGTQVGDFYCSHRRREQCDGGGLDISATANYNGRVNLTALPSWQDIKSITITRYGQGNTTVTLDGSATYVDFSDTHSVHTDVHITGDYGDITAKAGISALKYYYA